MATTAFIIITCFEALLLSQAVTGQAVFNCSTGCSKTLCSTSQNCCWCTKFTYGPYQTCGCCPSGTTCCSSGSPSSVVCCPSKTSTCVSGQCIRNSPLTALPTVADMTCTNCDASATVNLTITPSDNIVTLYVDGVPFTASPVKSTADPPQDVFRITATACVIAVQVVKGTSASFVAQIPAYGVITDNTWKCEANTSSLFVPSDWFSTTFNDTDWLSAVNTSDSIWSSASSDIIYCRKTLPTCAGNQCGVSIPGCVNPCIKAGKACCGSQMVPQGPELITTCCPKGKICAGATSALPASYGQQLCCPAGSVYNNSTCVTYTIAPVAIQKLCGTCK